MRDQCARNLMHVIIYMFLNTSEKTNSTIDLQQKKGVFHHPCYNFLTMYNQTFLSKLFSKLLYDVQITSILFYMSMLQMGSFPRLDQYAVQEPFAHTCLYYRMFIC
jgi:hypothetical protein